MYRTSTQIDKEYTQRAIEEALKITEPVYKEFLQETLNMHA
jgi:hypothetical protein